MSIFFWKHKIYKTYMEEQMELTQPTFMYEQIIWRGCFAYKILAVLLVEY